MIEVPEQLKGERHVVHRGGVGYPVELEDLSDPPESLYLIGDPASMESSGLAVIGSRRATPYGRSCAKRFAHRAAERGVLVVSGGAKGCDSAAHAAALDAMGKTIVFLGGGCNWIYPAANAPLFQRVVDTGGAIVSEHPWDFQPRPWAFRRRNRLIAAMSQAVLIVEAGLPSGTFTTADEALDLGREVLVVPGAITSEASLGSNRLLCQGATPVVDDESFDDALFRCFGLLVQEGGAKSTGGPDADSPQGRVLEALRAAPMDIDSLYDLASEITGSGEVPVWLMEALADFEGAGLVARQLDGRWSAVVPDY